ncbi:hypothetical protein P692DRAFT_20211638 [Suillus brevipes Sb2]|nr:hypothetical protein P692DRAFT_20211638 [Suillus brevipes Sb2]
MDVSRYIRCRQMYLLPIIICYHRFVSLSLRSEHQSRPFAVLSVISLSLSFALLLACFNDFRLQPSRP